MDVLRKIGLVALVPAAFAWAQQPMAGGERSPQRAIEVWAGVSRHSSQWGQLGDMPDESLTLSALRLTQRIHQSSGVAIEYGVDLIPIAVVSPPYREDVATACESNCASNVNTRPGVSAHGAGINPISISALFRPDHALQFRIGGSGGALWFDERVPTTTAAQFNFTGALDFGAQLIGRHGSGVVLMYRFHHLSNAGRGHENPGIASHVISLGARWRVGREG
jgi:Lipid A 3-O-deacylase (PagL)